MADESVVDSLRKARELVAKGWTKRAFARKRNGKICVLDSKDACSFCASGAMRRIMGGESYIEGWKMLERAIDPYSIIAWNDDPKRTQAEVVAAFDRAIAIALSDDDESAVQG